jgi:gamma-glutamyltranspeptidase/glutathione hydrolase
MRELEHTTHLSVADRDGMVVSLTTTLSASFGAKVIVPGTGIFLNNAVASFATAGENLPAPGRRTISSMAPTLVLRDKEVVLVLGTPGGDTIPSTIAQVLRRLVDHGATLDLAIDAPRIHQGFVPDQIAYERDRPPARTLLDALAKRGHTVKLGRGAIGDANNLLVDGGAVFGYADPRGGGLALAAKR